MLGKYHEDLFLGTRGGGELGKWETEGNWSGQIHPSLLGWDWWELWSNCSPHWSKLPWFATLYSQYWETLKYGLIHSNHFYMEFSVVNPNMLTPFLVHCLIQWVLSSLRQNHCNSANIWKKLLGDVEMPPWCVFLIHSQNTPRSKYVFNLNLVSCMLSEL